MKNKRAILLEELNTLISYTFMMMERYLEGKLTDEQMEQTLKFIDDKHDEIESEFAVLELLESVSLN
mgnify:CR=1 FL=1